MPGCSKSQGVCSRCFGNVVSSHTGDRSGSSSCCVSWRTDGQRRAAEALSVLPRAQAPATPVLPWARVCYCLSGKGVCALPRRSSSWSRRLALKRRFLRLRPRSYGCSGGAPRPVGGLMCTHRWAPWSWEAAGRWREAYRSLRCLDDSGRMSTTSLAREERVGEEVRTCLMRHG